MNPWGDILEAYYEPDRSRDGFWIWYFHPEFELELRKTFDRNFHEGLVQGRGANTLFMGHPFISTTRVGRMMLLPTPKPLEITYR